MAAEKMPAISALPFGDRWRVLGSVRRGEALQDLRFAAAAVEVAESYQRTHGCAYWERLRWFVLFVGVTSGAAAVWFATGGETLVTIGNAAVALTNFTALAISPVFWPKNVARSLEASKAIVGSGE
jgi:hypothetical protein